MLNDLLEFGPLVRRFEFHQTDSKSSSQTLYLYSEAYLLASSQTLLHKVSPLSVYASFLSLLAPLPISMLKYLYILNGRKILFFNLTQASSHCLTYTPTLPSHHTFWKLSANIDHLPIIPCFLDSALITPLITPLKWVLLDHSNPMIFIQFLFQSWSLNNTWTLLILRPFPRAHKASPSQGHSSVGSCSVPAPEPMVF